MLVSNELDLKIALDYVLGGETNGVHVLIPHSLENSILLTIKLVNADGERLGFFTMTDEDYLSNLFLKIVIKRGYRWSRDLNHVEEHGERLTRMTWTKVDKDLL